MIVDAHRIARAPSTSSTGDDRAARFVYTDDEVAKLVVGHAGQPSLFAEPSG
jgi:hypothetical protein